MFKKSNDSIKDKLTAANNSEEASKIKKAFKETADTALANKDIRIVLAGTGLGAALGMITMFPVGFCATVGLFMSTYHVATRNR